MKFSPEGEAQEMTEVIQQDPVLVLIPGWTLDRGARLGKDTEGTPLPSPAQQLPWPVVFPPRFRDPRAGVGGWFWLQPPGGRRGKELA